MNDATRKRLTEFLGEGWSHEITMRFNRSFTTRSDMMDLYVAIYEKGLWVEFEGYAAERYTGNPDDDFDAWLFCLNGQDYESRCEMVADWWEGRGGE